LVLNCLIRFKQIIYLCSDHKELDSYLLNDQNEHKVVNCYWSEQIMLLLAYCEISNILTGLTHILPFIPKGLVSFI